MDTRRQRVTQHFRLTCNGKPLAGTKISSLTETNEGGIFGHWGIFRRYSHPVFSCCLDLLPGLSFLFLIPGALRRSRNSCLHCLERVTNRLITGHFFLEIYNYLWSPLCRRFKNCTQQNVETKKQ